VGGVIIDSLWLPDSGVPTVVSADFVAAMGQGGKEGGVSADADLVAASVFQFGVQYCASQKVTWQEPIDDHPWLRIMLYLCAHKVTVVLCHPFCAIAR